MSFTPVIPAGGLAGLRFIDRTRERQFAAFARSPDIRREVDYFLAHAAEATTAEGLVRDPRLLRVALGAFGLEDEAGKRAFIRRILDEGTLEPKALANRLADPAWAEFARALGYGDLGGLLVFEGPRTEIAERYRQRQFERAVGDVDLDIRLALNFRRQIRELAADPDADRSGWFRVIGSQPLRRVIETAYGLPEGFAQIDIERQRSQLEARTAALFGRPSPAVFADAAHVEDLLRRFLAAAQMRNGPSAGTPGMVALSLLQAGGLGAATRENLFASGL